MRVLRFTVRLSVTVRALNIDDVVVTGGPLVQASAAEVDALESRLWIKFPSDYREYVERLGEGVLGGTFIRIYPPWRIETELVEWRRRIQKYWFWDQTPDLLPKDRALECVIVGDTLGGDELIFHPCRPDRLLVLPRNSEGAMEAGSSVLEAIEWMCSEPELTEPFSEREFEPFDSRIPAGAPAGAGRVVDPEGESLDDIVELGRRWVERHSARETYLDAVEQHAGKGTKTQLILEAILLSSEGFCDDGYVRRYAVIDDESESRVGVFQVCSSDHGSASFYEQSASRASIPLRALVGNDETSESPP